MQLTDLSRLYDHFQTSALIVAFWRRLYGPFLATSKLGLPGRVFDVVHL